VGTPVNVWLCATVASGLQSLLKQPNEHTVVREELRGGVSKPSVLVVVVDEVGIGHTGGFQAGTSWSAN
jgi:hypothetical protein